MLALLLTAGLVALYGMFRRPELRNIPRGRSRRHLLILGCGFAIWALAVAVVLPAAAELTLGGDSHDEHFSINVAITISGRFVGGCSLHGR